MALARIISVALRLAQFLCAAIVLGLSAYFLHNYEKYRHGPFARLVYSTIISAISVWLALLWMVLPHATYVHFGTDLILCAAWFAVFGLLQDYYDDEIRCGDIWSWEGIDVSNNFCGQWNAAQAFSFLAAVFWFASFLVGILAWSRARTPVATDGAPAPAPAR